MGVFMILILMHGGQGFNWGSFHPVLVHFPIVLFTAALICDLLNGIGKKSALVVGHWMVIVGALSAIPTVLSGLEASEGFDANDALIYKHYVMGLITLSYGLAYGALRFYQQYKDVQWPPLAYVVLSVILVSCTSMTSDYGGLITHGHTPFSSIEEKSVDQ